MKKGDPTNKYIFFSLLGIITILSAVIIYPFIISLVTGALLAYILYPIYNVLIKRMPKSIAAFLVAILIILLITVPSFFIISNITTETSYVYIRIKQQIMTGEFIEDRCYGENSFCKTISEFNELLKDENVKTYIVGFLNDIVSFITKKVSDIIFSIPTLIIHLVIILFAAYYSLVEGKKVIEKLTQIAPLKVHHQDEIFKQFNDITWAVVYGNFIVALVQGAIGAFGFWIFGLEGFLWWGLVMTFFALIPFVGTGVVWFPASVYLALSGYLQGEPNLIWKGAGLFLYGFFIISTIDNIIRPFIVSGKTKVHSFLIMLGVIGGLFVFGIIGLLLGPLILALLQTMLSILERELRAHKTKHLDIIGKTNHRR